MTGTFEKYEHGAYHWGKLRRRGWHYHARLHARYHWFVQNTPHGTIIDLGCGDGALTQLLQTGARNVIGIEPDPRAVELARSLAPGIEFRVGTTEALEKADAIVMCEVIEHVADAAAIVRAAREAAPALLISTPQRQAIAADPLHVHEFDADELHDLLTKYYERVTVVVAEPAWLLSLYLRSGIARRFVNLMAAFGLNVFGLRLHRGRKWHQLYAHASLGRAP